MKTRFLWILVCVVVFAVEPPSYEVRAGGQAAAASARPARPAPGNLPGNWVFIAKAQLDALMGPARGDRQARVVDIGGGSKMGVHILHYPMGKDTAPQGRPNSEISDFYYVLKGEGTALLGGKTQKWATGDGIIVPAGVPHVIGSDVTTAADILRIAVDPNKGGRSVPAPADATFAFIPKADFEALMKGNIADTPARMMNVNNAASLGAFILHMEPRKPAAAPAPVNSFYHAEISEMYYILRGSGVAMLGGELENATWDDSNSASIRVVRGPSANGVMKNAVAQKFSAGDIIIVPPGTPHGFTYQVDETTDIVRAVVDHTRALELK
jgi:mannose-6-phosphate isomerase-like protein (cupin superfamily)